jgi:Ca2+-binding EF-hand superfamily protein
MFELEDEEKYNAISTTELGEYLQNFLADSKLDAIITAIAQVIDESPAERCIQQLQCIQDQLRQIGNELK